MSYEKVNFADIRSWLSTIPTEKEVLAERDKYFNEHKNISEKQIAGIARIFAERLDAIADERAGIEHWDDKEYANKIGWKRR